PLTMKTLPLAVSRPSMNEGPRLPVARLRVTELASGWTNLVLSLGPLLNVFQLMIARSLDWLSVTAEVPVPRTAAVPMPTVGPSGLASAGIAPSGMSAVVAKRRLRTRGDIAAVP